MGVALLLVRYKMNRPFNRDYLQKKYLVKKKTYKDIKIEQYENGFLVKPDYQPAIAISISFGVVIASLLRNVNQLFLRSEATELIAQYVNNDKEVLDESKIISEIQEELTR